MLLVGDLGGTKTNLAVVDRSLGPRRPVAQAAAAKPRPCEPGGAGSEFSGADSLQGGTCLLRRGRACGCRPGADYQPALGH